MNGLFNEAHSDGGIRDLEFGIKSELDSYSSVCTLHSVKIEIDATNVSMGFDSVSFNGWNIGYEIKYNHNQFIFGVSKPNEVSGSRIKFLHPVARTRLAKSYIQKLNSIFQTINVSNDIFSLIETWVTTYISRRHRGQIQSWANWGCKIRYLIYLLMLITAASLSAKADCSCGKFELIENRHIKGLMKLAY